MPEGTQKKASSPLPIIIAIVVILAVVFMATSGTKKPKVKLVYVDWACATAATHVVKNVIEEKLGYEVVATPVTAAAMWEAVKTGDQDGFVTAWLPTTHADYYANAKDQVDDLGPCLTGTRIGLVVPKYVTINSIDELQANAKKFSGKITGIDPAAGVMKKTEQAMKDYGLKDFELVSSSGAMMTAALGAAIEKKEWIVVTGWTPHWKFGRYELKYLEDPKKIYGGEEAIHTIARKGLQKDFPKVYKFLDQFEWDAAQLQALMDANTAEGADPDETAKQWIKDNPELVEKWLK